MLFFSLKTYANVRKIYSLEVREKTLLVNRFLAFRVIFEVVSLISQLNSVRSMVPAWLVALSSVLYLPSVRIVCSKINLVQSWTRWDLSPSNGFTVDSLLKVNLSVRCRLIRVFDVGCRRSGFMSTKQSPFNRRRITLWFRPLEIDVIGMTMYHDNFIIQWEIIRFSVWLLSALPCTDTELIFRRASDGRQRCVSPESVVVGYCQ